MDRDGAVQCRICLSSSDPDLGDLISPCNCAGSMQYVHTSCLRTWRTQGDWRTASECPVCRSPYRHDFDRRPRALRLFLSYPVISAAGAGAALLRILAPWLHRDAGGAVWMWVAAPFQGRVDLWGSQDGVLSTVARVASNSALCLLLPALADHFSAAFLSKRRLVSRLGECILLAQLASRLRFLARAAWVRSFEGTSVGRWAKRECADAIARACASKNHPAIARALLDLNRQFGSAGRRPESTEILHGSPRAERRFLSQLLRARMKTEVDMLMAAAYERAFWWPQIILWYCAEQEVLSMEMARATLFGGLLSSVAEPLFDYAKVDKAQVQATLISALKLLCSIRRGAWTVRMWVLRFAAG